MANSRTVIVTGSSSGIGQATAGRLERAGWRVFATMRRPDPTLHGPDALALDVTRDASVAEVVATVLERTGRLDAIVNNAGVDMVGAVEETSVEEALSLFQTNFFGVHRLVREALPIMRRQGHGHVVTVGSIGGFLPMPFDAFYCASKHALKGYVETLSYEVEPFGVACVLIEPGFIKTSLGGKKWQVAQKLEAYAVRRNKVDQGFNADVGGGIDPDRVAEVVESALDTKHPRLRQRVGPDAHRLHLIKRFLPEAVFRMGMKRRS